jgi:nucleoside-diphosphate-sugar epimerase
MRVFVAGASGAIGRQLVPALVAAGHQITATTRNPRNTAALGAAGASPVLLDGLDAVAVGEAVATAEPDVIVHEMTAIPPSFSMRKFDQTFAGTNELRTKGIDHLLAAAAAAGVGRVIAQSYAGWPNARTGGLVKTEDDPLDPDPPGQQRASIEAIRHLEAAVTSASGITGLALRYGSLYGPGTTDQVITMVSKRRLPIVGGGEGVWSFLHIQDAATATVAAVQRGATGVYNIVDDEPAPVSEWVPAVAKIIGAKPPWRVPVWLGRLIAGDVGVSVMTEIRGSSNAKAKRELGWQPRWASWRDGFAVLADEQRRAGRSAADAAGPG